MTELRDLVKTIEAQVNEALKATRSANENTLPLHVSANNPESSGESANDSLMAQRNSTSSSDPCQISSSALPHTSDSPQLWARACRAAHFTSIKRQRSTSSSTEARVGWQD